MGNVISHIQKESFQKVFEHIGAIISDVSEIVYRRPASVQLDDSFLERAKSFQLTAHSVKKFDHDRLL
jgi:hypothetical protein